MTSQRTRVAREAAVAGGKVAAELFRTDLTVERKDGKTDVVTRADRDTQRQIIERIEAAYPGEAIVAEENDRPTAVPDSGPAWIVDPIDGTHNYVSGIRRWATSVAAVDDGDPVAAANALPALGDTYVAGPDGVTRNGDSVTVSDRSDPDTFTVVPTIWWGLDRREEYAAVTEAIVTRFGDLARFKSAQATLSLVAAGAIEGTITTVDPNPWDTVAGAYMVERGGGTVTDLDGEPWDHDSVGLVASNGQRHELVLEAAREAAALRERKGT
jgi:myo-inositol-1(or 4)-monophosphatase